MNVRLTELITATLIALAACPPAEATRPRGQSVIYADFGYINYVATSQRHVYFATTNGIIVYNKMEQHWDPPLTGADGIDNQNIRRIWVDRFEQSLCAQTDLGYLQYDSMFGQWYTIPELPRMDSDDKHVTVPPIMIVPQGFVYMPGGNLADNFGRSFPISDMVDDGTGNVWIGTWGYGPARASSISSPIDFMPFGLIQNPAYAVVASDDSLLWIGGPTLTSNRTGITVFNRADLTFQQIESGAKLDFPLADVNCLEIDSSLLYAGTSQGLYALSRDGWQVTARRDAGQGLPDQTVLCLKKVGDSLFVGTAQGLMLLYHHLDSMAYIAPRQFANRMIYDLKIVDDYLWIGSNVGAYRLALGTNHLQRFQDPDQILFNRVFSIHRSGQKLWLASDAGVVQVNIETGATTPFRLFSSNTDSRALTANDSMVAVVTDRGFTIIFLNRKNPLYREFSVEDGLPSIYVFSLVLDGDYLWVGTDKGLCRFWWNNPFRVD